jgi:hypothetical protein
MKYTMENYEGKTKIEISRLNRMTKSVEHILSYFEVLKGFDKIIHYHFLERIAQKKLVGDKREAIIVFMHTTK